MKTKELRKELEGLRVVCEGLERDLELARAERAKALKAADADPDLPIAEAARLAGLSRFSVYKAIKP